MRRLFLGAAFTMLLFPVVAVAQTNEAVQTIRGQVCDVASGEPMIGVKITVENGTSIVAVSDEEGNFVVNNVPVGRHSVRATYIGYEPVLLKEQMVTSGKELVLTLRMRENIAELGEVVVTPRVNKQLPLNEMAQQKSTTICSSEICGNNAIGIDGGGRWLFYARSKGGLHECVDLENVRTCGIIDNPDTIGLNFTADGKPDVYLEFYNSNVEATSDDESRLATRWQKIVVDRLTAMRS